MEVGQGVLCLQGGLYKTDLVATDYHKHPPYIRIHDALLMGLSGILLQNTLQCSLKSKPSRTGQTDGLSGTQCWAMEPPIPPAPQPPPFPTSPPTI